MPQRALAILQAVNPPEEMSGEVAAVEYRHADDGRDYRHDFGPGVTMDAEPDGSIRLTDARGRGLHRDFSGQTFLVNPPKKGARKMAKRMPPRHRSGPKKGQFRKRAVASRAAPRKRRRATSSRAVVTRSRSRARARPRPRARSRKTYRRNPPRKMSIRGVLKSVQEGAMDAALILTGKAATRSIPLMANLPKEGNIGLAVQGLTALVVSLAAQRVLKPAQARMVLAGGLTAPLETLIVSYNVPFLAPALRPVEGDAQLSAYLGGYVAPAPVMEEGVDGYVDDGMGDYGDGWAYA